MKLENIKKVSVIGSGVIGASWIIKCLAHNKKVITYDKNIKLKKRLVDR
jgi:carnitine 3-dehydrogenase